MLTPLLFQLQFSAILSGQHNRDPLVDPCPGRLKPNDVSSGSEIAASKRDRVEALFLLAVDHHQGTPQHVGEREFHR